MTTASRARAWEACGRDDGALPATRRRARARAVGADACRYYCHHSGAARADVGAVNDGGGRRGWMERARFAAVKVGKYNNC